MKTQNFSRCKKPQKSAIAYKWETNASLLYDVWIHKITLGVLMAERWFINIKNPKLNMNSLHIAMGEDSFGYSFWLAQILTFCCWISAKLTGIYISWQPLQDQKINLSN